MMTGSTTRFTPVRLGIVGLGDFGRVHALTAAGVAEAELVALVDSNAQRLADAADGLPPVRCWTELGQALAESNAEAWIIASSTASHVPLSRMVLEAGKPVLLEKPIADEIAAAESLAPLVRADSSNLMLGHVVLFNTEFQRLLREVRERGAITFIDCVRHRPATTLDRFPGETPFHLTMVHDLYQVLVLMEGAEPVRVTAQVHTTSDGRIDLATAQLQWDQGAIASLTASFMTPAGMPDDGFDRLEVFGQGWAARLQANPRPLEIWDDAARWPLGLEIQVGDARPAGMLAEQLRCFCRVVRGIEPVPAGASYQDALRLLRWIDRLEAASH